ncbi:MAG TPA: hypothetical protein VKB03_07030 [Conexibacter sp.]|nr:hypothetical protein [Conexibacter sp.]
MAQPDHTQLIDAGIAAAPLIADPKSWINRRVETIELLSHEEVRRQVSVDFTLTDAQLEQLRTSEGVVVPLTVLVKERRRAFSLRDESGAAIPVLGRRQNGDLALAALLHAASNAVGVPTADLESVAAELRAIVFDPPAAARDAFEHFLGNAVHDDSTWSSIAADPVCRSLLDALWPNYVLFAVLVPGGPNRRILKYDYTEDVGRPGSASWRERLDPASAVYRFWYPDRRHFLIRSSAAWRASSFHAEIVIPEDLRFGYAALHDADTDEPVSSIEFDVDRASLHAMDEIAPGREVVAALEIGPERTARISQASATAVAVAALLWLGAASGLNADSPDAAVSILLGGAAIFAGITAVLGEHRLVSMIFSATRRWLSIVTAAALAGSTSLALALPDAHPVAIWRIAAALCTVAAVRLTWSWIRARA